MNFEDIEFDSEEEELFWYYLEELKDKGFVDDFEYNTKSFTLSEPYKYTWLQELKTKEIKKESTLLQGHIYTPDFYIVWNEKAKGIFYELLNFNKPLNKIPFIAQTGYTTGSHLLFNQEIFEIETSIIEIKPAFDFKNMTRLSIINQKWMMEKHNIYIQKIIPVGKNTCLFAKTFVPEKAKYTKKKKQLKKFKYPVRSLEEFLNGSI